MEPAHVPETAELPSPSGRPSGQALLPTAMPDQSQGALRSSPPRPPGGSRGVTHGPPHTFHPTSSPPVDSQEACVVTDDDDKTRADEDDEDYGSGDARMMTTSTDGSYLSEAPSSASVAPRHSGACRFGPPSTAHAHSPTEEWEAEAAATEGPGRRGSGNSTGPPPAEGPVADGAKKRGREQGQHAQHAQAIWETSTPATLSRHDELRHVAKPPHKTRRKEQRRRQGSGSGDGSNDPPTGQQPGGDGDAQGTRAQPTAAQLPQGKALGGSGAAVPTPGVAAPTMRAPVAPDLSRCRAKLAHMQQSYTQVQQQYLQQVDHIMAAVHQQQHQRRAAAAAAAGVPPGAAPAPASVPGVDTAAIGRALQAAVHIIRCAAMGPLAAPAPYLPLPVPLQGGMPRPGMMPGMGMSGPMQVPAVPAFQHPTRTVQAALPLPR